MELPKKDKKSISLGEMFRLRRCRLRQTTLPSQCDFCFIRNEISYKAKKERIEGDTLFWKLT